MSKKISAVVKKIADAHIAARISGNFDNPETISKDDAMSKLRAGVTFSWVMEQVEIRFCSVGSILMSRHFDAVSQSYKAGIYKGFKSLLQD